MSIETITFDSTIKSLLRLFPTSFIAGQAVRRIITGSITTNYDTIEVYFARYNFNRFEREDAVDATRLSISNAIAHHINEELVERQNPDWILDNVNVVYRRKIRDVNGIYHDKTRDGYVFEILTKFLSREVGQTRTITYNIYAYAEDTYSSHWFNLASDGIKLYKNKFVSSETIDFYSVLLDTVNKKLCLFNHGTNLNRLHQQPANGHLHHFGAQIRNGFETRCAYEILSLHTRNGWTFPENTPDQVYDRLALRLPNNAADAPAVVDRPQIDLAPIRLDPLPIQPQDNPLIHNNLLPDFDPNDLQIPQVELLPEIPQVTNADYIAVFDNTIRILVDRDIVTAFGQYLRRWQRQLAEQPVNIIPENDNPYAVPGWGNEGWK